MSIDSLNWKILKCLQENARMSNAEIGRRVGVSSPAVSERIKKMEDAEIIQGYAGKDASQIFDAVHAPDILNSPLARQYQVGVLEAVTLRR